jgi:D-beta-D-heptose 7-phosphate kinase / D-beta-D-heptose 1-phosphate adenosyltransferase
LQQIDFDFSAVHIVVIGDVMLDRYWHSTVDSISKEAPVPVAKVLNVVDRPGGAANVAINLRMLGCKVSLFGVIGEDEQGAIVKKMLEDSGICCFLSMKKAFKTTSKYRIVNSVQQVIRADFEEICDPIQNFPDFYESFQAEIAKAQVCIFSDYAKGSLRECQELIKYCKAQKVLTLVDPKTNYLEQYRHADLVKPNKFEFLAMVDYLNLAEDERQEQACKIMQEFSWSKMLITLGRSGMVFFGSDNEYLEVAAEVKEVFDVTGAGDTVIALVAACLAKKYSVKKALYVANFAAGIVVKKQGTSWVSIRAIQKAMNYDLYEPGIHSMEKLKEQIRYAKDLGHSIIFTNGCFDLLHAGHVHYLLEAKKLGDRLIVAVNMDASVQKLKGPNRPIQTVEQRMSVLAALKSVDWVIPFSEDTPLSVIQHIKPNVIVKGGDYKPTQIVGASFVQSYGGEVKVLPFVEGNSTSKIIKKIALQAELVE